MRAWKTRLATLGAVVTFDYPYMRAGRKRPDPHDTLLEAHREALRAARKAHPGLRVALVGKSMGSRIGCHLALEEPVDAIVCLGYPLVSPGKSKAMRDEVLLASKTPILFVQGTRDAFCPLDVLARVRKKMRAPNDLYVVETGNHSLEITAARARAEDTTQPRVDDAIRDHIAGFLEGRG